MTPSAMPDEIKRQIQRDGFGLTGTIGGQPKTRYWTPDGRVILAAPSMREYVRRNAQGEVLETGLRDANLDKGWLLAKPTKLKLFCQHCDLWHDTQKQVAECGQKRQHRRDQMETKAKKELLKTTESQPDSRLDALEKEMGEIKGLLKQLVKGK